jgi:excisionase family DNA binding protein
MKKIQATHLRTVNEAARQLGVSAQTVRHWADRGKLAVMRTGSGQRLFDDADVEHLRRRREQIAKLVTDEPQHGA